MGSRIDELRRREAAARAQAEELPGQITLLADRLGEEQLSRLVERRGLAEQTGPGPVRVARAQRQLAGRSGETWVMAGRSS